MKPTTSVLTCTLNMRRFLGRAIHSVFRQNTADYELIILDDGSSDGTWELLQRFARHPRVRLLRNFSNQGIAHSRSRLLFEARGRYLSILDADDEFAAGKLNSHRVILDRQPSVGIVWGPALLLTSKTRMPQTGYRPGWDIVTDYQTVHSATTWRKSAVIAAGGYPREVNLNEDADLFLRVGAHARQFYLNRIVARKRLDPTTEVRKNLHRFGAQTSREILERALRRRFHRGLCESKL